MKFLPMLCLLFIGLKLAGAIDWSWWFVMAPIYASALLAIVAAFIQVSAERPAKAK